jgi:hypothetical protein
MASRSVETRSGAHRQGCAAVRRQAVSVVGEQAAAAGVVANLDGEGLRVTRIRGMAAIGFEGVRLRASGVACF